MSSFAALPTAFPCQTHKALAGFVVTRRCARGHESHYRWCHQHVKTMSQAMCWREIPSEYGGFSSYCDRDAPVRTILPFDQWEHRQMEPAHLMKDYERTEAISEAMADGLVETQPEMSEDAHAAWMDDMAATAELMEKTITPVPSPMPWSHGPGRHEVRDRNGEIVALTRSARDAAQIVQVVGGHNSDLNSVTVMEHFQIGIGGSGVLLRCTDCPEAIKYLLSEHDRVRDISLTRLVELSEEHDEMYHRPV